jgi:hypothetical protein
MRARFDSGTSTSDPFSGSNSACLRFLIGSFARLPDTRQTSPSSSLASLATNDSATLSVIIFHSTETQNTQTQGTIVSQNGVFMSAIPNAQFAFFVELCDPRAT